jgi:hypothetical protein
MIEGKPSLGAPLRSGGDGVPEVFCVDEQSDVPIELERWRRLALNALQSENIRGAAELAVLFVDEVTIAEMNAQFMGKSGPTDVLAFPVDGIEVVSTQGPGEGRHELSTTCPMHRSSSATSSYVRLLPHDKRLSMRGKSTTR